MEWFGEGMRQSRDPTSSVVVGGTANTMLSLQLTLLTAILRDMDQDPTATLIHLIQQRGPVRWNEIPLPTGEHLGSIDKTRSIRERY